MSIVCESRKWVFVHIPKNGGHSITWWANPQLEDGDMTRLEWETPKPMWGYGIEKHSPAADIIYWMEHTGRVWNEYESFAIYRHPESRAEAIFKEAKRMSHMRDDWYWSKAGKAWWRSFDEVDNVNDFISAGLLDPGNPLNILKTQAWFTDGVKTLVPISKMDDIVPRLTGLSGKPGIRHPGGYQRTALSAQSREYIQRAYEDDYRLPLFQGWF